MNAFVKSAAVATVMGLGIFASAGSAYAAGCLSPDQTRYSLADNTDTARDAQSAANSKGFRCDAVASEYSVVQPNARVEANNTAVQAAPQNNTSTSLTDY